MPVTFTGMRRIFTVVLLLTGSVSSFAQKNEIAFSLGGTTNNLRNGLTTTSGKALQANYARRLLGMQRVSVSGEFHLHANPQRQVSGSGPLTRDFASLYLTPGVRVKLNPQGRLQPWVAAGGGYALYEQSTSTLAGAANPAPRHVAHGVVDYGGGVDVPVRSWLALRGEVRDFYTGLPALNLAALRGGAHNTVVSAGFVVRLGK